MAHLILPQPMEPAISRSEEQSPTRRRVAMAVWGGWAIMTLAALAYVVIYGRNVPSWDDWDMVPTMTGRQPVTLDWLWSQHNEHRIPVPRLVMLAVYRSSMDFRAGMIFNVLLTAGMIAWLLQIVAKLRGRLNWADLFLPLVALNLGQGINFMWGWQIEFFVSTVLLLVMLAVVVRAETIGRGAMLIIGGLIVLLAGSGAHGLVPIPALVVWAIGATWLSRRQTHSDAVARRIGWGLTAIIALVGIALVAAYLIGYQKVPHHPTSAGLRAGVQTAIKAVTMSFGAGVREVWPLSGGLMMAVLAATVGKLVFIFWKRPAERVRAWGLFCFIGAVGGLAAALGLGRNGFEPRYVTLLFPLLCAVYFTWSLDGKSWAAGLMRAALAVAALLLVWPNSQYGVDYARDVSGHLRQFEQQMADGVPTSQLIARHSRYLHPIQGLLADYMPMLRDAHVGAFAKLRDDPPVQRVTISPEQWNLHEGTRDGRVIRHQGKAWINIKLPEPTLVAGVTLVYDYANPIKRQPFIALEWRGTGQEFSEVERRYYWSPTGDRANWERGSFVRLNDPYPTSRCWIWETVTELRISPDYTPGTFELKELVLTTAAGK